MTAAPTRAVKYGATVEVTTEQLELAQAEALADLQRWRDLPLPSWEPAPLVLSPAMAAALGVPADRAPSPAPGLVSLLLRASS